MTGLAILGGAPAFPDGIPFARPLVPELELVVERLRPSYDRGMLTNGPIVRAFEDAAAERLGVRHAVAVASCTSGLLLAIKALAPEGHALLPSFTFSATAHAVHWNGMTPLFAECTPSSFQLDVVDAAARIAEQPVGLVVATHVFGTPCPAEEVEKLGRSVGAPVIFDAAHGFGASRRGRPVGGFGDAEVFSLSPTKPVIAGEGGLVATDDADIAEAVRLGRDYGNPGDYDTLFAGLNARMSELHAALALESLALLDGALARRQLLAGLYRQGLEGVPGIAVQVVDDGDVSTYKDFTIAVHPELGVSRDTLVAALQKEGVDTRCYFDPPVHRHRAYTTSAPSPRLPVTDQAASRVVSLPLFDSLPESTVEGIGRVVRSVNERASEVRAAAPS